MTGTDVSSPARERFSAAEWWLEPFEMFQTNLREVDAVMDVERAADEVVRYGADTWLVNAGGILSFYPTALPFQTRNPHLDGRPGGDLLGDAVGAAHRRGLRLLARMDFSKISMAIAEQHPEWCFVDADGEWQVYNGLVSTCPSGAYYQERAFEVIDEVIDRYDVDGFFFNWFGFSELDYSGRYRGVSQDEASRRGFAEFSGGRPLPTGPESPDYDLWRQYSATVVRELTERINAHIRARRPNIGLIRSDIVFYEANNEVGRELWHHATGEAVSAFRSRWPERPVVVNSVIFLDMPYRLAGEQPEHYAQYHVQALARGANPSTYIMGAPGDIPYPGVAPASAIAHFHERWKAVYDRIAPCADIGLIRPDRLARSLDRNEEASSEFRGLYASLQQRHLPFDVVPEEGLSEMADSGGLARYRVLVLPDLDLSAADAAVLDSFAAAGGSLVLTGASGFAADGSGLISHAPSSGYRTVQRSAEALKSSYVAPAGVHDGIRHEGPLVPVLGTSYEAIPAPGSEARLLRLGAAPFGPPEKAYGNLPDGTAGYLLARSSSGGVVAQIPWTIGRSYHELGLTVTRDIVTDVVEELSGPGVRASLPEQAELTVQRSASGLVIHILNLSGARRSGFGPELPLRDGRLRIPLSGPSGPVRALVADRECASAWREGMLEIELPEIGLFDVVVVPIDPQGDAL